MSTFKWFRGGASVGALLLVAMLLTASGAAAPKRASLAPVITSFKPTSGAVGTFVTIVGQNLTGATVSFGSVPATTPANPEATNTATEMTTTVPGGATTGSITVSNGKLGKATSATAFTVTAALKPTPVPMPAIVSFKPASGTAGTLVTIAGNGLVGVSSVKFGGVRAKVTQVFAFSSTKLSVKVPAGAKSGKITVTALRGTGQSAIRFTVR
jgi:IPT/TIG domain-containing protein